MFFISIENFLVNFKTKLYYTFTKNHCKLLPPCNRLPPALVIIKKIFGSIKSFIFILGTIPFFKNKVKKNKICFEKKTFFFSKQLFFSELNDPVQNLWSSWFRFFLLIVFFPTQVPSAMGPGAHKLGIKELQKLFFILVIVKVIKTKN